MTDPGSRQVWASVANTSVPEANAAVAAAHAAFQTYKDVNPRKRAELLLRWHQLITEARDDLAKLVVHETGKPVSDALSEIDYSLGFAWWFAGETERIRGTLAVPSAPGRRVLTVKQPVGVTVAMVPWNFPIA